MNPSTVDPPLLQPPQPPQAHRPSTSCPRHPEENFTGFCPSCLCERLAVLDHSASASTSTASASRKPPLATAALRAIFKPSSSSAAAAGGATGSSNNYLKPSSFFPELRRTKSFSASKNEGFSGVFEPQRKSCDVRGRNTLWSLFSQDDGRNPAAAEIDQPRASTSSLRGGGSVFNGEIEIESDGEEEIAGNVGENPNPPDINLRAAIDEPILTARNSNAKPIEEIIEEENEGEEEEEEEEDGIVIEAEPEPEPEPEAVAVQFEGDILKPMKDHIDLDSQTKKPRDFKEIAGSFWSAASVFSKKLQKWRQKQKMKKRRNGGGPGSATLPVEKPIGRQYRETQSEIADYGFGRRSCDTDPRFSLDAGRISFDDPRYSFDEPRASWDGYLIGRTFPRMPTMLSVVEDATPVVTRSDAQIPVEESTPVTSTEDEAAVVVPGGSIQTRDYYSDSSSRRRKSLDRSNSIRKTAAAVVAEIDELKSSVSSNNSKVSPATVDSFPKLPPAVVLPPDRDWRDSNSNSLRDDCSIETFEMGFRDNAAASVVVNGKNNNNNNNKKSRRWGKAWNIWGFIHRRSGNKDDDEDSRYSRANGVVERSFSESWPELRGERHGDGRMGGGGGGGFNHHPKLMRSNSSVSWRHSNGFATAAVGGPGGLGSFGSGRKSNVETCSSNGGGGFGIGRKKKDEFVLERNRSARYSPSSVDNGLLRFYLTPLRGGGSRRAPAASSGGGGGGGIGGWGKAKTHQAHSIARSVLRLY